ncbi:NUDIX domain-containing protein [Caldiplasma sukawensis]
MRRNACVSVVHNGPFTLYMKRKERQGDPWSSNVSFPGGFMKEDESPLQCALRELNEETGITEESVHLEMHLPIFHPMRFPEVNIYPFIFKCQSLLEISVDSEMEYGGWIDLSTIKVEHDNGVGNFFRWRENIVWGLTFRITDYCIKNGLIT